MVANKPAAQSAEQQFGIQRIYMKDASWESPNSPVVFNQPWEPKMNLDINTGNEKLEDDVHEVTLTLTVTVQSGEKVAFIAEAKMAGIFSISGFDKEQLSQTLGSFCPNIIYPYAREVISDLVMRGGFPQLVLAPINFDALYGQHQDQLSKEQAAG